MKRVRIEFHGGFKDGDVVAGDSGGRGDALVRIYFFLADRGRIGQRFRAEPEDEGEAIGSEQWLDDVLAIEGD